MYLLSVSVAGNGRGGNQPIITQQSFKNVLPKSIFFSSSAQVCRHAPQTHTHTPAHPPTHSLPPSLPPVWIRLSLCACHGLAVVIVCWTGWTGCPHVSCQAHSTARPPETLQNCLCFWFTSQIKTAAADWQKKKKSSPRFLVFPWSLPQFSQPDFCMEKELASYPVIVAFWLLPPSEHCLSQNSFLLPDTKEIFGESSHPLQKIHKSQKKKKKGKKRNG